MAVGVIRRWPPGASPAGILVARRGGGMADAADLTFCSGRLWESRAAHRRHELQAVFPPGPSRLGCQRSSWLSKWLSISTSEQPRSDANSRGPASWDNELQQMVGDRISAADGGETIRTPDSLFRRPKVGRPPSTTAPFPSFKTRRKEGSMSTYAAGVHPNCPPNCPPTPRARQHGLFSRTGRRAERLEAT